MQPHIRLSEELNVRYAILPGDPARVERIAAFLENKKDYGINREYRSIAGTWQGIPVLAMSTGMGGPSAAIAVEELQHIGITHIIRIGSCGALQSGIRIGELIVVQGAVRDDGTSRAYAPESYPAISDAEMLQMCSNAAEKMKLVTHTGIIRSHDSFYIDEQDDINAYWSARGILGSDMETAAILTVARLRGVKALSILNNVVSWGEDTFDSIGNYCDGADAASEGEKNSILLALETIRAIHGRTAK